MPNDWTPTDPASLPWGETVEVRNKGKQATIKARSVGSHLGAIWIQSRTGLLVDIDGTLWRRLEALDGEKQAK